MEAKRENVTDRGDGEGKFTKKNVKVYSENGKKTPAAADVIIKIKREYGEKEKVRHQAVRLDIKSGRPRYCCSRVSYIM